MFIVQVLAVTYGYRSEFYNSVAIHMHILESIVLSTTVNSFIFGGQRTCPIFCNVHVHNIYTLSKGKPAFFQYCTCSIALNTKKETQRRMIRGDSDHHFSFSNIARNPNIHPHGWFVLLRHCGTSLHAYLHHSWSLTIEVP